jgi:hypothetical protein
MSRYSAAGLHFNTIPAGFNPPLEFLTGFNALFSAFIIHSMKGGSVMATPIHWETSLTTAKAKAKKEKKLILMDFYNNL